MQSLSDDEFMDEEYDEEKERRKRKRSQKHKSDLLALLASSGSEEERIRAKQQRDMESYDRFENFSTVKREIKRDNQEESVLVEFPSLAAAQEEGLMKRLKMIVKKRRVETSVRLDLVEGELDVSFYNERYDRSRNKELAFAIGKAGMKHAEAYLRLIEEATVPLLRNRIVDRVCVIEVNPGLARLLTGTLRNVTSKVGNLKPKMGRVMGRRIRWPYDAEYKSACLTRQTLLDLRPRTVEVQDAGQGKKNTRRRV